jgi:hypothetical protein
VSRYANRRYRYEIGTAQSKLPTPFATDVVDDLLSPGFEPVRARWRIVELIDEPTTPVGQSPSTERTEIGAVPVR